MSKNLIICRHGAWNTGKNTDNGELALINLFKIFHMNDLQGNFPNPHYRYQAGVWKGGLLETILGGVVGGRLSAGIRGCYLWLCKKIDPTTHSSSISGAPDAY